MAAKTFPMGCTPVFLGRPVQPQGRARDWVLVVSLAVVAAGGPGLAQAPAAAGEPAPSPRSLFNGRDLSGWHADVPARDEDPAQPIPFIVRDGLLVSLGTPGGHLTTADAYGNYRLAVEYRFPAAPGNCGLMIHSTTPRALFKMFPRSLEVQMAHRHAGDFWCNGEDITVPDMETRRGPRDRWGTSEEAGRHIRRLGGECERPAGEWNSMVIECRDESIKVWVNDALVNDGCGCTRRHGRIAIQSEGSEVEFRRVELTPLPGFHVETGDHPGAAPAP